MGFSGGFTLHNETIISYHPFGKQIRRIFFFAPHPPVSRWWCLTSTPAKDDDDDDIWCFSGSMGQQNSFHQIWSDSSLGDFGTFLSFPHQSWTSSFCHNVVCDKKVNRFRWRSHWLVLHYMNGESEMINIKWFNQDLMLPLVMMSFCRLSLPLFFFFLIPSDYFWFFLLFTIFCASSHRHKKCIPYDILIGTS